MAAFHYRAVNPAGKPVKGVVEATGAAGARQALRAKKLMPLSVEPARVAQRRHGLGTKGLVVFTRQLATLVAGGVRVEDALATLAAQGNARSSALALSLRVHVLEGRSFAAALSEHTGQFDAFYRASVEAGELAGRLGAVLEHLADHVERQARNRQAIELALIYPALLSVVSLAVIVALLVFVVPDIVRVFAARGAELPALTRALIALSEGVTRFGLAALLALSGAALVLQRVLATPVWRARWHRFLATARGLRRLTARITMVQFSGTLATLMLSRVTLTEALAAAAGTVRNLHVRREIEAVAEKVREGRALSAALSEAGLFPPMMVAIVASGEASGTLPESLALSAADQARELEAFTKSLVALVEPMVLLVMGGIVMILVLAIMLPIINLNNLVGG